MAPVRSVVESSTKLSTAKTSTLTGYDRSGCDFVGPDLERLEPIDSEGRRDGYIGSITAAGHEDSPDAGHIVAGVERVPLSTQKGLEPGAKIHWIRRQRHANIAKIPGAVTSRHVQ